MPSLRPIVAVLGAALLLVGPAQAQNPPRHPYTQPHVLRWTLAEDPTSLNLHGHAQTIVRWLDQPTMAWLLRTGKDNAYEPELATVVPSQANGGISADGKTITWHLRRDAKWSDGAPFTAEDIVFTTKTVLNPATIEDSRLGWDHIVKTETPDPYTVVYRLREPYADFLSILASEGGLPILPAHVLKALPDINRSDYNALPVGIGPFKFTAWKRGDSVVMEANPNYFRGRPKLDRIVYRIIPDRNTALAQIQTHEVDMWVRVPGAYFDRIKELAGTSVLRRDTYSWNHLDFVTSHPPVSDPVVRRALRLALDRETLRVKIGHGVSRLWETPYGPAHPAHMTHPIPLVPFDIAAANRMLDAAGWVRGSDGVRAKNAVRLDLTFGLPSGSPDTDQQVELIRSWWEQLGVKLSVQHYAEALFFAPYANGGIVLAGKADVFAFGWTTSSFGDLTNLFGCKQIPPKGQNEVHFCDPHVDAALRAQLREYDPKKRLPYTDLIQRRIFEAAPTIVTSIPPQIYVYNSDLTGFSPNVPTPFDDLMNVDI